MSKRKREQSSSSSSQPLSMNYKGVTENGNHYVTSIWIAGIQHYRGTFHSPLEAARAYDHAAIQAGHATTDLNFPEEAPPPPAFPSRPTDTTYNNNNNKSLQQLSSSSSSSSSLFSTRKPSTDQRALATASQLAQQRTHLNMQSFTSLRGTTESDPTTTTTTTSSNNNNTVPADTSTYIKSFQQQIPPSHLYSSSATHAPLTTYSVGYRGVYKSGEKFEAQISKKDNLFFYIYIFEVKARLNWFLILFLYFFETHTLYEPTFWFLTY